MRYLMTFSYDGTNYNGYQKQPDLITIQSVIEEALTKINSNKNVIIHASGRTDSGVHALNQKAHFDLDNILDTSKIKHSLNSLLPKDIYIKDIEEVNDDFHARFDVVKKEYIYQINIGEYNPIDVNYIYQYNNFLDIEKIKKALSLLEGEHDFSSFTKMVDEKETYVRTIYTTEISMDNNIIIIKFVGNGFLRYMVRNMVGLLIEIGSNKKEPTEVLRLFEVKDRKEAGLTAPPNGLYLNNVYYE